VKIHLKHLLLLLLVHSCSVGTGAAAVGNPQMMTDHPWYPGELACSTFERLAATQAAVYRRVTGRAVATDEDRAIASWLWRNTHLAHGQDGAGDYFDKGFRNTDWNRDYWQGLFAHGFALCGTTHSQWTAEMQQLLGHCRSRSVGVRGHNSFEVFLKGGAYGSGRWALLDHDLSTIIFSDDSSRLLSIPEVMALKDDLLRGGLQPPRQRGWRISGLHAGDIAAFEQYRVAEYLSGYGGPPPMVHLRSGETLRRFHAPGLDDGKTVVFWGLNYRTADVPGPERSRTWVNQPEAMHGAVRDAGHVRGQARYGNARYLYQPNFGNGSYREGVIDEGPKHVTFEFQTPYVIGATPPNEKPWGIYDEGGRNGLLVRVPKECVVQISTDRGGKWSSGAVVAEGVDFTDQVKGHQQYWLRLDRGAKALRGSKLRMETVCQLNPAILPRLQSEHANRITSLVSGTALMSAGPNLDQAMAHRVDGDLNSASVTLELATPRGEPIAAIYAASHNASGNPPSTNISYVIDVSFDRGATWSEMTGNSILRQGDEPGDFWSQSFTFGSMAIESAAVTSTSVQVRFRNDGRKRYRRVEAHVAYGVRAPMAMPMNMTMAWTEAGDVDREQSRRHVGAPGNEDSGWVIPTGKDVEMRWVEFSAR
jgi:hypothetical protein